MNGIVGKLSFDRQVQISPATVRRMLDAIAHRRSTPCGERPTYLGHGVALAALGEKIEPFPQVAHNEAGTIRVVADADLSNAAPLRRSLAARRHAIEGATDAELIAHAYEEWGDACVEHLAGAFACAIWDDVQRRLLLARDRFGIRPLCFALLHGDGVVFASELQAVLQDPGVGRGSYPDGVDAYLRFGSIPAPLTIHPRISKLAPAHTLVVDGRRLTTRRYWELPVATERPVSEREALDLVETCLRTSAAAETCDGRTSVLLSGGVASTALATVSPKHVTAVTIGIDTEAEELDRVFEITARLGLPGAIDTAAIDAVELTPHLATHFDEPTADPDAVVYYATFAAARRYAPIAATAHGASALWGDAAPSEIFDAVLRHGVYTRRFSARVRDGAGPPDRGGETPRPAERDVSVAARAAAAAGLHLRCPFLSRDLVDLACMLPRELRSRRHALGQIVRRHIPAALLDSRARTSRHCWLSPAIASLVPGVLLTDRFDSRGIFSRLAIRRLWDEHHSGRRDHARRLWALLMLEFWFREFVDGDTAEWPLENAVLVRAA